MRKVIYSLAASLDGFIATKDGGVDWLKMQDLQEAGDEMSEFYMRIDTILYGRKTFEKGLEFNDGSWASFKGFRNIVFTSLQSFKPIANVEYVHDEAAGFVERLKEQEGKDILLMGGGEIGGALLENGLIDELIIGIQPVVLGEGIPIFAGPLSITELERTDTKLRKSGTVQISYLVEKI